MYRVSIPINCHKFHWLQDRQPLLDELRGFDCDRVMLNFETALDGQILVRDGAEYATLLSRLGEACAFFKGEGYEVGAWLWGLQFGPGLSFTEITTLSGKPARGFACPSDPAFRAAFARCLRDVARAGVDLILLNDDLRFGAWSGFGCLCENHVRMICEATGERLTATELRSRILSGGKNKYRDALIQANRAALESYAREMRAALDSVNPAVRLGFCACPSAFDIDGDAFALARLLAGGTRPILRLFGAPYHSACGGEESRLPAIVEQTRMQAAWGRGQSPSDNGIELIAEGDVYPRPRLHCAASYLEGFDLALRASGELDGILRICIDYVSSVGYESGYLKKYLRNKPLYADIKRHFSGKTPVGIRVYEAQRKLSELALPNALGGESDPEQLFYSSAARFLSGNAIPTVYTGRGTVGIVFGENARMPRLPDGGLILDAPAAALLLSRGVDLGITALGGATRIRFAHYRADGNRVLARNHEVYAISLAPTAEVLCDAESELGKPCLPYCYRYENASGGRFLVFNCDGKRSEYFLREAANARLVADAVEWLSGRRLPACAPGNPSLYMQCASDGESLTVGLWNFFEDEALAPTVRLGESYRSAEFFGGGSGRLSGDTVLLSDIPPYGFCGITLHK